LQARELEQTYEVEREHWWFRGKRDLFERLLGERLSGGRARILDVGCGAGATAVQFSRFGTVVAADRSAAALGFTRSRGVRDVVGIAAPDLPFAEGAFDIILAFDVIEHIEDDEAFVADLMRCLRPGGVLAVHVPAWPSLWSVHDEILEHKRRYTRRGLRRLLTTAGFELERYTWSSCILLPAAVALRGTRRLLGREDDGQDLGEVPAPLNRLLLSWYHLEALLACGPGLPFGLSLAAIARRPG
jgi:SAM-dependent methyltransferase